MPGRVDDPTRNRLLRQCDLLCLPSINRGEAFGLVLLEAMALGKPALVTRVPGSGMSWVVDAGHTGWHVEPEDPVGLARQLAEIRDQRDMLGPMGRQAQRQFRRAFFNRGRRCADRLPLPACGRMNPPGLTAGSLLLIGALWAPQCAALSCQERGLLGLHGVLGGLSPDRPISVLNNVFAEAVAGHEDQLTNPTVGALLSEPLTLDPHAWPLTRQGSIDARIDALRRLAGWRVAPMRQTAGDLSSVESPESTAMQHLMDRFAAVEAAMAEALRDVSMTDRLAVIDGIPGWLDRIASDLGGDGLREPVMRVAGNIDYAALHRALGLLLAVTEPAYRERLGRELGNNRPIARPSWLSPSFQGSFLYARQTPDGPVLIGGAGPNTYGEPARLVIDLGGDDLYSASIDWVIDLAGNDMYLSSKDGALGAGLFSAGMILDASGNDVYAGGRVAQGAGLFGVGVLWDVSGDDIYSAQELAQGAAMFGAGLLVDLAGHDRFAGAKFNQGFGGPRGLGGLLDVAGRDLYVAGAKHASSYGTPENYQAFSQGAGMGFATSRGRRRCAVGWRRR